MPLGNGELVDRIYEAAVIPEMWPSVLDDLARVGEGEGALLFTEDGPEFRFAASSTMGGIIERYLAEGWAARSDRVTRLFALQHAGFARDLDVYTIEEMDRTPVFTEFLRPEGLGWGTATAVTVPSGERLIFDVERAHARGPVPIEAVMRLDALRPHLARAATMSTRLRLRTAHAAGQALDAVGLPAVMLGRNFQPLTMNAGSQALIGNTIKEANRLALADPTADALLAKALATLSRDGMRTVRSIPIRAHGEAVATVLHILPIRRAAADLFEAASAIAVFTPLSMGLAPVTSVLEGLFDLTSAEARVARGIATHRTVDEIALGAGTSRETVRTQLKSVMAKTGTRRQSELAGMLAGVAAPVPLGTDALPGTH